jgi:cobalt-zinc-cadmium efflux system membrane fusion protein
MSRSLRIAGIALAGAVALSGAAFFYSGGLPGLSRPAAAPKAKAKGGEDEHGHGEGAVALSDAKVAAAGIELLPAGPATLHDGLPLNGIIQPNQETLVQVTPRFAGVIREVKKRIGDGVAKGDLLAVVESNQSLTSYELRAPIAGTVIDRQAALGEYASEQKPAFVIADLTNVWVDFSIYRRDLARVRMGDKVSIDIEDGKAAIETQLTYVSPVGSSETQSALARAIVPNADGRLRPGLFVRAKVLLTARPVPVAVKLSALQTLENRTVVFVREGEKFEARDVVLGERDAEMVEVTFGLGAGDQYAARNSFVIKAELAKGTASHEH